MMSILLLILKIIGIILLVILGLILLSLCLVIFVPLRYKVHAGFDQNVNGTVHVHWLLHLISVKLHIRDKDLRYQAKVCGFPIVSSDKSSEQKKDSKEGLADPVKDTKHVMIQEPAITDSVKEAVTLDTEFTQEAAPPETESTKEVAALETEVEKAETAVKKKRSLRERIAGFFSILQAFYRKIWESLDHIKCTILSVCDKLKATYEKITDTYAFATSDSMKQAIHRILKELKRIVRRLLPKRWDLSMHFGLEDPATTGKLLGTAAMVYPFFPGKLAITPNFHEKELRGDTEVKGHIRLASFIGPAVRILLDKNVRNVYRTWKAR